MKFFNQQNSSSGRTLMHNMYIQRSQILKKGSPHNGAEYISALIFWGIFKKYTSLFEQNQEVA